MKIQDLLNQSKPCWKYEDRKTTDGTVLFESVLTRAATELTKGEENDFLRND